MQKIIFSLRRTLTVIAIGLFGLFLNLIILAYFIVPETTDFTYLQWVCIGAITLSSVIQYGLIKLVKKSIPLR